MPRYISQNDLPRRAFRWEDIDAVILDVDGTLYLQNYVRLWMILDLLLHILKKPTHYHDILIRRAYRKNREILAEAGSTDFIAKQYDDIADQFNVHTSYVRNIVKTWIEEKPLPFIDKARRRGCREFILSVFEYSIQVATYSDYPSSGKIETLNLPVELQIVSSDPSVARLKPDPTGVVEASRRLNVPTENCLMIGDRDERDGACARAVGMPYLIISKKESAHGFTDFFQLRQEMILAREGVIKPNVRD
jgi:beta-phosphoglucomutase-like phosphatase (HAD superfamily)